MASKIIVLDEKVANQIAAGEVIERPASIVKELVENSIDAGSTRIQVEIVEGGRTSIRVLDNGEGIGRVDVATAFERHATSKIREAADLFSIRTLGFRGEALPSIASVSRVTLQTRTAEEPVGTLLKIEGGEITDRRDVGLAVGTDFLVEDLFFNTPARLKYLKTTTTELGQISDLFNHIAVAVPGVAMSLTHNGRSVCRTPGTGRLLDVIYSIYGRELVDNLLEVEYEEDYITVTGFVSRPAIYRSSRKHQSYYVNGRYVRSISLSHAVSAAYDNLMPENRNPVVFLFVKINPVHVDVNVHPTKSEVKFSRPEIVSDVVTRGIRKTLLAHNLLPTFHPLEKIKNTSVEKTEVELTSLFENAASTRNIVNPNTVDNTSIAEDTELTNPTLKRLGEMKYQKKNWDPLYRPGERDGASSSQTGHPNPEHTARNRTGNASNAPEGEMAKNIDCLKPDARNFPDTSYLQSMNRKTPTSRDLQIESGDTRHANRFQPEDKNEENTSYPESEDSEVTDGGCSSFPADVRNSYAETSEQAEGEFRVREGEAAQKYQATADSNPANFAEIEHTVTDHDNHPGAFIAHLLPIGQIHHTYIIAQGRDGFYVIDQHVAHERVLYEEIMATFRASGLPSQILLIPLTLELTLKEVQVIQENEELFNRLGFVAENFGGNTVIVRAVPKRIDERSDKELFLEIVDMLLEEKKAGDRAQVYHKLITSMSCKGAIKAGERLEQGEMIQLLQALSRTENPHFCPHGRPIMFHIAEHDLLKAFQRI